MGQGIGGFQRVEHRQQLRLGGAVVPVAIPAKGVQQLVDGLLDLAAGVQRGGIVQPGLLVGGIGLDLLAQLVQRTGIGGPLLLSFLFNFYAGFT